MSGRAGTVLLLGLAVASVYGQSTAVPAKHAFTPLPPGAVTPQGWLLDWARDAANGITGHLDERTATFGEAWKGYPFKARGALLDGTGWPLEQSSYWLDGAARLAYILNDRPLIDKVSRRLDMVMDGVLKGGPSFIYFSPRTALENRFNNWAHSHMGRALVAYYQATGNPRILEALVKTYREYPLPPYRGDFSDVLGAVNIDPMLDTYTMSGDRAILQNVLAYARTAEYRRGAAAWRDGDLKPGHNVIFYENIRVPALLSPWTGDAADLEATGKAIAWSDERYLLPMGLASGEEFHAGIGATRNVETCDVPASMWTFLTMLRITGQSAYSDRIEQVFFNAGPAPVARDFQTMCYYQSPNRYSRTLPLQEPNAPGAKAYQFTEVGHEVLCCVGNLNRVIPFYVQNMWMSTPDQGIAAALYGPSRVRTNAGGVPVEIDSTTNYPFDETIKLTVKPERETAFPLYVRIPRWCRTPQIKLNGKAMRVEPDSRGFAKVTRTWRYGDVLALRLSMQARILRGRETPYPQIPYFKKNRAIAQLTRINSPYASVYYGPLLFALPIRDENPNREAPDEHFNYALDVGERAAAKSIRAERGPMPQKWNWALDAPLKLRARVAEFDWTPSDLAPLPAETVKGGRRTTATLVPYGCTKFRVSMMPVTQAAWGADAAK